MRKPDSFLFWTRWLFIASLLLALQGVTWIIMGSFDPFGIYDGVLSRALLNADQMSDDTLIIYQFMIGLLGATDAAFFVLFAFIAKYPFANQERWAHVALITGFLTWFILDTGLSFHLNAVFNIFYVNVPCLLLIGIPLVATASYFYSDGRLVHRAQ